MIEVELKFRIDAEKVREKIQALAKYSHTERNEDIYFNHPQRDFAQSDEALRIRTVGDEVEITYKGPKFNTESKSRRELNLTIEDNEKARLIFEALGFYFDGEVKKIREVWKIEQWDEESRISPQSPIYATLDKVEGLGDFLEMEIGIDEQSQFSWAVDILKIIVKQLGIDPETQILRSYLSLLKEATNK